MNNKDIEKLGFDALRRYLESAYSLSPESIIDNRNAGHAEKDFGCDAIVTLNGKRLFVELKASMGAGLPTNIRFTHQTMATMHNAGILQEMIVAYVYNLREGINKAKFKFFRFGDFSTSQIKVEPHFIIQPKQLMGESEGLFWDDLDELLEAAPGSHDIADLFDTKVSKHMKLS